MPYHMYMLHVHKCNLPRFVCRKISHVVFILYRRKDPERGSSSWLLPPPPTTGFLSAMIYMYDMVCYFIVKPKQYIINLRDRRIKEMGPSPSIMVVHFPGVVSVNYICMYSTYMYNSLSLLHQWESKSSKSAPFSNNAFFLWVCI